MGPGRWAAGHRSRHLDLAHDVGRVYEATLSRSDRRRGAHYTPLAVAFELVSSALDAWGGRAGDPLRLIDPTCGAGVFLLAALDELVARGWTPPDALASVRGVDIDPGAVEVANRAVAIWAEGHDIGVTPPRVTMGECFEHLTGSGVGSDIVVGNPPFRGQLRTDTAHDRAERTALRARFGEVAEGYVDLAALVTVAAVEALRPGGVCVLILPRSAIASRHGAAARQRIADAASMRHLWVPAGRVFDAQVEVCAPVLVRRAATDAGPVDVEGSWSSRLASADGVPDAPPVPSGPSVAARAEVIAGFRDHYYGLVDHVIEADPTPSPAISPLITSGLIAPGRTWWGERPARFAKQAWTRPAVERDAVRVGSPGLAPWLGSMHRPKVLVASQTKILEAVTDLDGTTIPITPVVAVIGDDLGPAELAAALSAPVVSVWLRHRLAGTGLSRDTIRIDAGSISSLPLPLDPHRWKAAAGLLAAGPSDRDGWRRFGREADAAYGFDESPWLDWWLERVQAATR